VDLPVRVSAPALELESGDQCLFGFFYEKAFLFRERIGYGETVKLDCSHMFMGRLYGEVPHRSTSIAFVGDSLKDYRSLDIMGDDIRLYDCPVSFGNTGSYTLPTLLCPQIPGNLMNSP
jgi:hypothetical protein